MGEGSGRRGCLVASGVDDQQHRLLPVAILGGLHPSADRADPPSWWLQAMKRAGHDPQTDEYQHFDFSWSDTNHNGKIEVEEIKLGSLGNTHQEAHCYV